jgi:hypothetical protein
VLTGPPDDEEREVRVFTGPPGEPADELADRLVRVVAGPPVEPKLVGAPVLDALVRVATVPLPL